MTPLFVGHHHGSVRSSTFTTLFKLHPTEKAIKITAILALALMSAMMIPAIQQLHAASQTIDGVITDSMCGKKHMMPGKTDTSI